MNTDTISFTILSVGLFIAGTCLMALELTNSYYYQPAYHLATLVCIFFGGVIAGLAYWSWLPSVPNKETSNGEE
jgi:hypothetical protein